MSHQYARLTRLIAAMILSFAASGLAAQSPATTNSGARGVKLTVQVGLSGVFRLGRWTPITITATNRGSDSGGRIELLVEEPDSSVPPVRYVHELELPRDSRKQVQLTALLQSFHQPLRVRYLSGDEVLAETEVELRSRFVDSRLIVGLSRDADFDYLSRAAPEREVQPSRVVYPHPQQLPQDWKGYDGVAAVIVHGVTLENLTSRQFDALRRWLAQGGVLAVVMGPEYVLAQSSRLSWMLPAIPSGLRSSPSAGALKRSFGDGLHVPRPFRMNALRDIRGTVRLESEGVPMAVEGRLGHGRILLLAFDVTRYPFDVWPGKGDFWHDLLALSKEAPTRLEVRAARSSSWVVHALEAQSTGFPPHGVLFAFLLVYASLLATAEQVRATASVRWRIPGLALWAAPAGFAVAAWYIFGPLWYPPVPTVVTAGIVEALPNTQQAHLRTSIGVYSPRAKALKLSYVGAAPAFEVPLFDDDEERPPLWSAGVGDQRWVAPSSQLAYQLHHFNGEDIAFFDVETSVEESDDALALKVDNRTPFALRAAWAVIAGGVQRLSEIPQGQSRSWQLSRDAISAGADGSSWEKRVRDLGPVARGLDKTYGQLIERALQDLTGNPDIPLNRLTVVALTQSPLRPAQQSSHWRHVDATVMVSYVPLKRASAQMPDPLDGLREEGPGR